MTPPLAERGAAGALAVAAVRRRLATPATLVLAALGWTAIVAAMTQSGFSGNSRYLVPPVALACVAGGATLGSFVRASPRPAMFAGVAAAALIASVGVRVHDLSADGHDVRAEAQLMGELPGAVRQAGGPAAVSRCGTITTDPLQVTGLAWRLQVPIERIVLSPGVPGIIFRPALTPVGPTSLAELPYRLVAQHGSWQVLAACGAVEPH